MNEYGNKNEQKSDSDKDPVKKVYIGIALLGGILNLIPQGIAAVRSVIEFRYDMKNDMKYSNGMSEKESHLWEIQAKINVLNEEIHYLENEIMGRIIHKKQIKEKKKQLEKYKIKFEELNTSIREGVI